MNHLQYNTHDNRDLGHATFVSRRWGNLPQLRLTNQFRPKKSCHHRLAPTHPRRGGQPRHICVSCCPGHLFHGFGRLEFAKARIWVLEKGGKYALFGKTLLLRSLPVLLVINATFQPHPTLPFTPPYRLLLLLYLPEMVSFAKRMSNTLRYVLRSRRCPPSQYRPTVRPASDQSVTIPPGMGGQRFPFHGTAADQANFRAKLARCRAEATARRALRREVQPPAPAPPARRPRKIHYV